MSSRIFVEGISFDYAHFLAWHPRCSRLHGHTSVVRAEIVAPLDARGMVIDFAVLRSTLQAVIEQYDHRLIVNEQIVTGYANGNFQISAARTDGSMLVLDLPADNIVRLPDDPTIENITAAIHRDLLAELTSPVLDLHRLTLECREGLHKGAICEYRSDSRC